MARMVSKMGQMAAAYAAAASGSGVAVGLGEATAGDAVAAGVGDGVGLVPQAASVLTSRQMTAGHAVRGRRRIGRGV
jgi:hypothetical protein